MQTSADETFSVACLWLSFMRFECCLCCLHHFAQGRSSELIGVLSFKAAFYSLVPKPTGTPVK